MNNLNKLLKEFNGNPSATIQKVQAVANKLRINLPDDYIAFLLLCNGGEGFVGDTYLMLWQIDELDELNDSYQVAEFAPGLVLIGSDGGGDAFAYDTRSNPWSLVKLPFIGMELDDVEVIAESFEGFLRELAK